MKAMEVLKKTFEELEKIQDNEEDSGTVEDQGLAVRRICSRWEHGSEIHDG